MAIICNLPFLTRRLLDGDEETSKDGDAEASASQEKPRAQETKHDSEDIAQSVFRDLTDQKIKVSLEDVDQSSQGVARLSISDGLDLESTPIDIVEASERSKDRGSMEPPSLENGESRDDRKSHSSPSPVDMIPTMLRSKIPEASSRRASKRRSLPPPRKYDPEV